MIVKGLYTILLGIFLMLFVSIGISTFYPEPVYQTPSSCLAPATVKFAPSGSESSPILGKECERSQNIINENRNNYVQIISTISLILALVYIILATTFLKEVEIFSNGFLFASIFTLLFSVTKGLGSNQPLFRFILICVSLAIVMYVGYRRFVLSSEKNHSSHR